MEKERLILIGLGNPGPRYAQTRHNCGFETLDRLMSPLHASMPRGKLHGSIFEGSLDGKSVLLVKPQTFMNDSGICVRAVADYYHVPMQNLLVIYDDIDLPVGQTRMRMAGSAGTHNGMRSIVRHLGREDFPRLRIGIGSPPPGTDLISYVLGKPFVREEIQCLDGAFDRAAQACTVFIREGIESAMRTCNTR